MTFHAARGKANFPAGEGGTWRMLSTAISSPLLERPVPSFESTMRKGNLGSNRPL